MLNHGLVSYFLETLTCMEPYDILHYNTNPSTDETDFGIRNKIQLGIGNFVVVDESGKEKALESGSKVACIVTQVLYHEQVRVLQKSPQWPAIFKSGATGDSHENLHGNTSQQENERDSSDDDELPPLEANTNRLRPFELEEDSESSSDTDD